MRDEKARTGKDGESGGRGDQETGRRGECGNDKTRGISLALTPSPRPSVSPSSFILPPRVVALAVEEAELLFAQRGVGDLDLHLAQRPVAGAVGGRVGDEVLRAQLVLDLREGGGEVFRVFGEEGAAARLLRDLAQEVAAQLALAEMFVADADRVDDRVVPDGVLDGLVDAELAARVVAVREEDDGAARVLGRLREHLLDREDDGVPDPRAAAERLLLGGVLVPAHGVVRRVLDLQARDG